MEIKTDKPVKVSYRKDHWGMVSAMWDYRGVTLHYEQSTKRRSPWYCVVYSKNDWYRATAMNKKEIIENVDEMIDVRGFKVGGGKIHRDDH
jgi:hypothetical protein